ncbi:TPA: type I toxin-antitoxin system toxin [Clostridioides difficile]
MDNFLLNVLSGVIASLIFYIISKLFRQVKNHSVRKSGWEFDLKIKFKKSK